MFKQPNYKKVVFVSDIHAPYQDNKAIKALRSFIRWYQPNEIIFLGDVVDFYAVSSFTKDPSRAIKLQEEIDEAVDILDRICKLAPKAKKYFLKGNHEHRMQKYLWSKAAELSGLRNLQIPRLLKLDELKIQYIENGKMRYHDMMVKHGNIVRKFSAYSANGEFQSVGLSGVSGHTHRMGMFFHTNESGNYVWMECGHLCDDNQEYMEGSTANWQKGFGIGFYKNSGSHRFNVNLIPIVNGKAMWGGYEFY